MLLKMTPIVVSLPNDILVHIVSQCSCINTFAKLRCVSPLFASLHFMNIPFLDFLKSATYNNLTQLDKAKHFILLSTHITLDTVLYCIENELHKTAIHLLVSYGIDLNRFDIVKCILKSKKWDEYRNGGTSFQDHRWKATIVSLILIDAVRKGSQSLVEMLISYGRSYVNVENYAALRVAFEYNHTHIVPILVKRLFEQKQYDDIIVL